MPNIKKSPLAPEFCNSLQGIDPEDLNAWNTEIFTQATSISDKQQAVKATSKNNIISYKLQARDQRFLDRVPIVLDQWPRSVAHG
jgi:hypothetical protein